MFIGFHHNSRIGFLFHKFVFLTLFFDGWIKNVSIKKGKAYYCINNIRCFFKLIFYLFCVLVIILGVQISSSKNAASLLYKKSMNFTVSMQAGFIEDYWIFKKFSCKKEILYRWSNVMRCSYIALLIRITAFPFDIA